jgi:CheY-like chemotaxis protein
MSRDVACPKAIARTVESWWSGAMTLGRGMGWSGVGRRLGQRVLVVDDHHDTTDVIAILLGMLGHVVRTAYRGTDALEAVESFVPDCAIIDLGLPDLSGYEVARRLRRRFATIRLIALSARQLWERARDGGFDQHVLKPVSAITLGRLVERDQAEPWPTSR